MNRLKKFLLPLILLVILVILGISLRNYLLAYIVRPVALLFWAAWRIAASMHQATYWAVLIGLYSLLVFRLAISGKGQSPQSAYQDSSRSLNPVEDWQSILNNAWLGEPENDHLRERLASLLRGVAVDDRQTGSMKDRAAHRQLSHQAQRYLFPPKEKGGQNMVTLLKKVSIYAPDWLRRWMRKMIPPDYTVVDEILTYIETELEIHHGI